MELIDGVQRESARPFDPENENLTEKQGNKKNAQRLLPASRPRQRAGAGGEPFQREQQQPDNGDEPENTAQNIKESRQREMHPGIAIKKEPLREARERGVNGDYPNGGTGAFHAVLFHTAALPVEAPDGSDRQQQEKALRQMRRLDALAREKEKHKVSHEKKGEHFLSLRPAALFHGAGEKQQRELRKVEHNAPRAERIEQLFPERVHVRAFQREAHMRQERVPARAYEQRGEQRRGDPALERERLSLGVFALEKARQRAKNGEIAENKDSLPYGLERMEINKKGKIQRGQNNGRQGPITPEFFHNLHHGNTSRSGDFAAPEHLFQKVHDRAQRPGDLPAGGVLIAVAFAFIVGEKLRLRTGERGVSFVQQIPCEEVS